MKNKDSENRGKEFNIDTFGKIIDEFLKENEIGMLITLPKGSFEAKIDFPAMENNPIMELYIMLHALKKVINDIFILDIMDETKKSECLDGIFKMMKADILEEE